MYTVEFVMTDNTSLEFYEITKIVYHTGYETKTVEGENILSHSFNPNHRYDLYAKDSVSGVGSEHKRAIKIYKEK